MHISKNAKLYEMRPLTGPLDPQSSPDTVGAGAHRWVQNFRVNAAGNLYRSAGWQRFMGESGAVNADLHNQFPLNDAKAPATPTQIATGTEEDITILFNATSTNGDTRLLAGTTSRLYSYNQKTNNYRIIRNVTLGSGKWKAAQLDDDVVFVNENAKPIYWKFDQPAENTGNESVREIGSFSEVGLNRVRHIQEWRGLMFYGNVHEGNEWVPDRLVWSDFKKPFAVTPGTESLAGYQDLGHGEDIVGMEPLGNALLIYTVKGVWQFEVSGGTGTQVLSFRKRFTDDDNGNQIPAYPNTIISAQDNHFYLGRDGVYYYNIYRAAPDKPPWLHQASSVIFDSINKSECDAPIAAFNAKTDEVWISWPVAGAVKNSKTLIINVKHKHVSYMDAGFSAFTNFTKKDYTSLGEWLTTSNYICSDADVAYARDSTEGSTVCVGEAVFDTAPNTPTLTNIYSTDLLTISDDGFSGDNLITEDWTADSTSSLSLYGNLGSKTFADICTQTCPDDIRFLMVSVIDNCIKEDADVYYRENCKNKTGCGIYEKPNNYKSILRSPALRFNSPKNNKLLKALTVEFEHDTTKKGGTIDLRIGNSAQAVDPNKTGCGLQWRSVTGKDVACVTGDKDLPPGSRAVEELTWPLHEQGRNLYYEVSVYGTKGQFEASAIRLYAETKTS
ncbi:MAG TPA: hypothetical protein EYN66_08065 [Myxococcales bacterium]|nr:hypothetical protein [Myxococcales bacterium]